MLAWIVKGRLGARLEAIRPLLMRLRGARRVGEAEFRAMGRLRHVRNALAHLFEPYL